MLTLGVVAFVVTGSVGWHVADCIFRLLPVAQITLEENSQIAARRITFVDGSYETETSPCIITITKDEDIPMLLDGV